MARPGESRPVHRQAAASSPLESNVNVIVNPSATGVRYHKRNIATGTSNAGVGDTGRPRDRWLGPDQLGVYIVVEERLHSTHHVLRG